MLGDRGRSKVDATFKLFILHKRKGASSKEKSRRFTEESRREREVACRTRDRRRQTSWNLARVGKMMNEGLWGRLFSSGSMPEHICFEEKIAWVWRLCSYGDTNDHSFQISVRDAFRASHEALKEENQVIKGAKSTVYDGIYHPRLGRFPKLDCSTTKSVPIPNDTFSESSRRDTCFQRWHFLAPTLFQLWRSRAQNIGPGCVWYTPSYTMAYRTKTSQRKLGGWG